MNQVQTIMLSSCFSLMVASAQNTQNAQADKSATENSTMQTVTSTHADQTELAVTVYNKNLALIRDQRRVSLPTGKLLLSFADVSAQIRPETLSLEGNKLTLLEQNFEYDLINLNALINKHIGKEVTLVSYDDEGKMISKSAKILANNDQPILNIDGKISTLPINTQIVFERIPENLRERPTMTMLLENQSADSQTLDVTYLTRGLSWKADYVANLLDEKKLAISGWITLNNTSGTSFHNTQLQLVAGDVNTVNERVAADHAYRENMVRPVQSEIVHEESLFEYHLYTLPNKTSINHNQQKQVALLAKDNINYSKRFVATSSSIGWQRRQDNDLDLKVNTFIEFKNDRASGLGLPIPEGVIRSYQNDSNGNAQFIGEDRINHRPENENITLKLGEAFDVTVHLNQTDYRAAEKAETMSYEATFKNAKDTEISVELPQTFAANWEILDSSHEWTKESANTAKWVVKVPAKGATKLEFKVKVTHR